MADAFLDGQSVRSIAKRNGCSPSTVSRIIKARGVSTDDAQARTRAATDVARERNAQNRESLQSQSLERAHELLAQMDQPHLVFNIGGKDNIYTEHLLNSPPTGDIKNLVTSARALVQTALDLARFEAESAGGDKSRALIERLADGLRGLAGDTDKPADGEGVV